MRGRSYKCFSIENYVQDVRMERWDDIYYTFDLNEAVQMFTIKRNSIVDKHAPW